MPRLLTSVLTNASAVVLTFPIALAIGQELGTPTMPLVVCITVAASAGFTSPLGYQTNLMVMGPGRYRPLDFLRLGLPLTVLTGAVSVLLIPLVFP